MEEGLFNVALSAAKGCLVTSGGGGGRGLNSKRVLNSKDIAAFGDSASRKKHFCGRVP